MRLELEKFIVDEQMKEKTIKLLNSDNDTKAFNLLKEITTIGELKKLRIFLRCQKKDIGINFTAFAIYISAIAFILPAAEMLFSNFKSVYIAISIALAISLSVGVLNPVTVTPRKILFHRMFHVSGLVPVPVTRRKILFHKDVPQKKRKSTPIGSSSFVFCI